MKKDRVASALRNLIPNRTAFHQLSMSSSSRYFSEHRAEVRSSQQTVVEEKLQIQKTAILEKTTTNTNKRANYRQATENFTICNVGEMRELQRKKAKKIASACNFGKKNKAAIMFQKRFERSEKFALVRDPSLDEKKQSNESDERETSEEVNVEENKEDSNEDTPVIHPELPLELSFLKIQVSANKFLPSPKPWQQTVEISPSQPPPVQADFNRCAKGFAGSYTSPYRMYSHKRMEETCDL